MKFYLGTHMPNWLWSIKEAPLFVSHRSLKSRKSAFPRATTDWVLDSGGFTELNLFGKWVTTPAEYVEGVRRYQDQLGRLAWASPQDWMCEPAVLAKTGLTIEGHQMNSVDNYLELRELAPELPFIPVLQGWTLGDYHRCADLYEAQGVDLVSMPIVGAGSVCRRQGEKTITELFESLASRGLNLHGFGVKMKGLTRGSQFLTSSDSMAWSLDARWSSPLPGHSHKNCANCPEYALAWYDRVLHQLGET